MFKVHGATVYPTEVEEALEGLDYVRRAFAIDVDHEGARRVGAAVVLASDDGRTLDDLEIDARQVLSAFKVPARWKLVGPDDIPRTATGKVDKEALRRL